MRFGKVFITVFLFFALPLLLMLKNAPHLRFDLTLLFYAVLLVPLISCSFFTDNSDEEGGLSPLSGSVFALLMIFLGSCIFSSLLNSSTARSLFPVLRWVYAAIVFICFTKLSFSKSRRDEALSGLAAFGVLAACFYVLDQFNFLSVFDQTILRPFSVNRNYLAHFLILPFLFFGFRGLDKKSRWDILLSLLLFSVIVLTRSRAVWIGVAIPAALYLSQRSSGSGHKFRKLLWVSVFIGLLCFGLQSLAVYLDQPGPMETASTFWDPLKGSAGGRLRRWLNAYPMILDNLFFGVGSGNWALEFSNYRHLVVPDTPEYPGAFNAYIKILAEAGLIAFAAFMLFISKLLKSKTEVSPVLQASAAALAITAFFHVTFSTPFLLLYFMAVLGLINGALISKRPGYAKSANKKTALALIGVSLVCIPLICLSLRPRVVFTLLHWHFAYAGDAPSLTFKSQAGRALSPFLLRNFPELDFRNHSYQLRETAAYASERYYNLFAELTRKELAEGNFPAADMWAAESVRELGNADSCALQCRTSYLMRYHQRAVKHCRQALELNPQHLGAHAYLVKIYRALDEGQEVQKYSDQLRVEVDRRLAWSDSGKAGRNYQNYIQTIKNKIRIDQLREAEQLKPIFFELALEQIASVPLVHKKIAVSGGVVYYSTNFSGRFELWKYAKGSSQQISDDAYVYFQPQIAENSSVLFFISDQAGDQRYQIFSRELSTGKVSAVSGAHERLGSYSLRPDGKLLAAVLKRKDGYAVDLIEARTGMRKTILERRLEIEDLSWTAANNELLFIENDKVLMRLDTASGLLTEVFRSEAQLRWPGALADQSKSLFVVETDGGTRGRLLLISDSGSKVIAEQALDPKPLAGGGIAFRQFDSGNYQLMKYQSFGKKPAALSSAKGVVYSVSPAADKLWYLRSTNKSPIQLVEQDLTTAESHTRLSFGELLEQGPVLPVEKYIESDGVSFQYFVYPAAEPKGVILWLHGSNSEFSPRWHTYAQFFANSGYLFAALNYEYPGFSVEKDYSKVSNALSQVSKSLVKNYKLSSKNVVLLGVSQGVEAAREAALKYPDQFSKLIEYSPIAESMPRTPGLKVLRGVGQNDPRFSNSKSAGSNAIVVKLVGEGHDLRSAQNIRFRLQQTLEFLRNIEE